MPTVFIFVIFGFGSLCWAAPQRGFVKDCDSYAYCEGQSFPNKVTLAARFVNCDQVPQPKDRCCLPQAKHKVCYGITVDGQYLNFDSDNYARTTDFTGLCNAMAQSMGFKVGRHSSAVLDEGGGHLVWRYGEWTEVEAGAKRIKNLACEIL